MKLLIDANILLDVLQKREPHYMDSSVIWKLCETEQVKGYVSVLSFANLVYVMRKELTPEGIEEVLRAMSLIFEFTELGMADMLHASEMRWDDFEDAVQSTIAERIHADYIITRNIRDFKGSKVMALTPKELIARW
ncbi:MAG: PIN domain-containing protein [Eubacteriales bacterium]|nr:PIN domain-containing protein [Eubacteriales bacterium]